jgi:hypothetical protein
MCQLFCVRRTRISGIITAAAVLALSASAASAANLDVEFDADNFDAGQAIDNQYWPLTPGTSFVYYAEGVDGCEANKVTVLTSYKTDFNPPYDDIQATEVDDKAWVSEECDGQYVLVEATTDWFAQDKDGNIWYFGEDTTSWDKDECPSTEGAWEAGADIATIGSNAAAGIIMLAEPEVGLAYQQEFYEGEAEDFAKVVKTDDAVSLQFSESDYEGCLKTKEWTPLERGAVENKFYCPPFGEVLVTELKGKTLRVELIGDSLDDVPLPEGGGPNVFPAAGVCP